MAFKSTNIGSEISVQGTKVAAQNAAGAINGPWVAVNDLLVGKGGLAQSIKAFGVLGNSATGTPTAATLTLKIQDATDSSGTGAADFKPDGANVAASAVGIAEASPGAGTNDVTELTVNMKNSRAYARVVGTLGFTGGTSPKSDVALGFVMGGFTNNPITDQNA